MSLTPVRYKTTMIVALLCVAATCYAQHEQGKSDSILQLISVARHDSTKVRLYGSLAELWFEKNAATAFSYTDSAVLIARDPESRAVAYLTRGSLYRRKNEYEKAMSLILLALNDAPEKLKAEIYLELGIIFLRTSAFDSSMVALKKGLAVVEETPNTYTEASLYNMMGNVNRERSEYERAISDYIQAAKLFEGLHNDAGLTQALSNIGNLHNLMGNVDKALEYALRSLETARSSNVKTSIAYSYRLLGRIYRRQKKYDDALESYKEAARLYRELGIRQDLGETFMSIGNLHYDKREFDEALHHYNLSLNVLRGIGDHRLATYAISGIALTLFEQKQYTLSGKYIDSTLLMAKGNNLPALVMDSYLLRSELYEITGNIKAAFADYRKYIFVRDSLQEIQNTREATELEARYEAEKKDDAIRLLHAENELKAEQLRSKNNLRNSLIVLLILFALIIVITYNRYKVKLRANQKLKELDETKSRFFTNVSHEFRTPLSLILGPLQELLKQPASPEDHQRLSMMHHHARRLQELMNQVLELSRIEAGNLQLHLQEEELSSLLNFIGNNFAALADSRSIEFRTEIFQSPYTGCFDRDKLEKILYNILSNAFKFTPDGGHILMRASVDENILTVSVEDSGRGIPADKLDMIFSRYYRVDESPNEFAGGTGIGLALAKELAEGHRGKIVASSTLGTGSTFTVSIPVSRNAYPGIPVSPMTEKQLSFAGSDYSAAHPVLETQHENGEANPIVLVAEDHPDMQRFICQILQDHYTVLTSVNGLEALEKIKDVIPDIVISDWMMPGMDGRTLCEKIKNDDATCHIPVLILTAKADRDSKIEGLETGADDYLTKPFDTQELLVRVQNIIQQRKRLRIAYSTQLILKPGDLPATSRDAIFISKVQACLEENYADPSFGVEEFAAYFSMSRMQLHRKLKALLGESPGDCLRHFRLERARQFFGQPDVQVSEVCFQVGFGNVANFSKAFREHVGLTPSDFIAKNLKKA